MRGLEIPVNVIGDGPIAGELHAMARELELRNVIFHGRVDEARKTEILLRSSIFVMASYREGWSLSTMEAMAHGLVPFFAHIPERYETGITSYARDGENAVAFDGSPEDLRRRLESLIADPPRTRRLREASYATAQEYGWPAMIANLENILSE